MTYPDYLLAPEPEPIPTADGNPDVIINIPNDLEAALTDLHLPAWQLDGPFLCKATMERYRTELTAVSPQFEETAAALRHELTREAGGYAVLRMGNLAKALGTDDDRFCGWRRASRPKWRPPFRRFPGGPCGRTSESRSTRTLASPAGSGTTRSTWTW
ncbi:hypothetical protein ACIPQH_34625 [Streptomyces rubiginosohelvolus]|uniref:hypothetical protein n=1 Tax=Streptomyces TaxID=1883 RepID=UPI001CD4985D|nr:hypothetical protein [Streptomyces sp. 7G]MCA1272389.1 hypothetical protein [Streptomyces sp. 7G]